MTTSHGERVRAWSRTRTGLTIALTLVVLSWPFLIWSAWWRWAAPGAGVLDRVVAIVIAVVPLLFAWATERGRRRLVAAGPDGVWRSAPSQGPLAANATVLLLLTIAWSELEDAVPAWRGTLLAVHGVLAAGFVALTLADVVRWVPRRNEAAGSSGRE